LAADLALDPRSRAPKEEGEKEEDEEDEQENDEEEEARGTRRTSFAAAAVLL